MPTEQKFPSSVLTLDESDSLNRNKFFVWKTLNHVKNVVPVENPKPATVFRGVAL